MQVHALYKHSEENPKHHNKQCIRQLNHVIVMFLVYDSAFYFGIQNGFISSIFENGLEILKVLWTRYTYEPGAMKLVIPGRPNDKTLHCQ